jgi:hypothetical protein
MKVKNLSNYGKQSNPQSIYVLQLSGLFNPQTIDIPQVSGIFNVCLGNSISSSPVQVCSCRGQQNNDI